MITTDSMLLIVKPAESEVIFADLCGYSILSFFDEDNDGVYSGLIYLATLHNATANLPNAYKCWVPRIMQPTAYSPVSLQVTMIDPTLDYLISSTSTGFRNEWIEVLNDWLQSTSGSAVPGLLEARLYVSRMVTALEEENFTLFQDLYIEL
jgi:hypothetical protein